MNYIFASWNFTNAPTTMAAVNQFVLERSLVWDWIVRHGEHFTAWIEQPAVLAVILAWAITFTVVMTLLLNLGFGPAGIVTGSLAAAFQSWMYGGFTPAAGIFATLTSVGMLGWVMPPFTAIAVFTATCVAGAVWAFGVGA